MNGDRIRGLEGGRAAPDALRTVGAIRAANDPAAPLSDDRLLRHLQDRGAANPDHLQTALSDARRGSGGLGDLLLARGLIDETDFLSAYAELGGLALVTLNGAAPDTSLESILDPEAAIAMGIVPWRWVGTAILVVASSPCPPEALQRLFNPGTRVLLVLAPRKQVVAAQVALYGDRLARRAEGRAPRAISSRGWVPRTAEQALMLALLAAATAAVIMPKTGLVGLLALTLLIFCGNIGLKIAAFGATLRAERWAASAQAKPVSPAVIALTPSTPPVTILIALYREDSVVPSLIAALAKLDYPPEQLDVVLCTEADDQAVRDAIAACKPPHWIRVLAVPPGHPRTKPRALNFGLSFARGKYVGIYDAEDRPEPDQIRRIVARFAECEPDVACLQGRLDYYNARHNLLSRCFAVEYASWFRVLLPGVHRLGLFVPLGGTTVFLRRDVLEQVGAWDAHNVTEDAELGLRLARHGYTTAMADTTTFEEANAATWPWIKQRTRWQKGYMMTWAAAMRRPGDLLRDLGLWRFLGLQVQLLFAVLGFLIAPLLWSLIGKPFGMPHPLDAILGPVQYGVLGVLMVSSLVVSIAISIRATRATHLRSLRPSILLSEIYHVLGTVAAWRAAFEMLAHPFHWSKTEHGRFTAPTETPCMRVKDNPDTSVRTPHGPPVSDGRRMQSTNAP